MTKVRFYKRYIIVSSLLTSIGFNGVLAGDVEILAAEFHNTGGTHWSVKVTLKHDDTGWEHYADNWRVEDGDGKILGDRILYHPHVNEQPFTRSLGNVDVPIDTEVVYISAHDKAHGWTPKHLAVDLSKVQGNRVRVESTQLNK